MKRTAAGLFIVALMVFTGCKSYLDENDFINPSKAQVSVRMTASAEAGLTNSGFSNSVGRIASTDTVVFDAFFLGVSEIEFEKADTTKCDSIDNDDSSGHNEGQGDDDEDKDKSEIAFEGNFIVDLLAGTSTPDFGMAQVSPGTYKEIEMDLAPVLPDGNSLLIRGAVITKAGDTIRFELSSKKDMRVKIHSAHGITLNDGSFNPILVRFRLDRLHGLHGLSNMMTNVDGIVVINDDTHPEIFHILVLNLNEAVACGRDDDRDGDIDED